MTRRRPAVTALTAAALLVAACSDGEPGDDTVALPPIDASSPTSDVGSATTGSEPAEPSEPTTAETTIVDSTPTTTDTTTPDSTTTTTDTTAPDSTTTTIPASTTAAPSPEATPEIFEINAPVPPGEFGTDPGALVIVETDGDLVFLPNGLSPGNEAPPIDLLDLADPREAVSEGPGPNRVDDVAGFVNGSLVYGDCCEPVSGNLHAVPGTGEQVLFGVGFNPNLSPDGTRLATANSNAITVADVATGAGRGVVLNQASGASFFGVTDLEWVDDSTLAILAVVDEEFELSLWDASTLTQQSTLRMDDLADLDQARFAGRTPDGMLGIEVTGPDLATVRMFDGLDEDVDARLRFPPTVSGIEINSSQGGLTWIDGGTLYYLPPGFFEARPLRSDVGASWFVGAP